MNDSVIPSDNPTEAGNAAPFAGQDLYRLLGLTPFESNPSVISSKVRDLMRETRKYQLGVHAARTQTRLEEIATATACLLDPRQKQVYDEELRRHYGMPPVSVTSTYAGMSTESEPVESAGEQLARKASERQRTTLVLVVIAIVVLIAWGYRLLAPVSSSQPKSLVKSTRPAPPEVTRLPAAAEGTDAAASAKPKRQAKRIERKHPVTATGTSAAAVASPCEVNVDPFVATIQTIVADGTTPATPAERETNPTRDKPPRRGEVGVPQPVNKPTDAPRAPPSPLSSPNKRDSSVPVRSSTIQNRPADDGPHLTPNEVLRELRDVRLKRTPAQRLSPTSQSLGAERVVELVQLARKMFGDDRRFQRQLDQEVVALKRLYPQLRDQLPAPAR